MLKRSVILFAQHPKSYINLVQKCSVHVHNFSRNMQLITNDKVTDFNGLQVLDSRVSNRPLTLLYTWLFAKDKHVLKYSKFYLDRGIEVLRVKASLFDILRPTKGSHIVAEDMLQFLHSNPNFGPIAVHGFSAGAYLFCESMVKVVDNMDRHGHLLKRFSGQVWDSVGDIYQIPTGFPRAVTSNEVLRKSMEKYLRWYMKFNYETSTRHYERSSQMMHANTLNVPGLFIFSSLDPVSDESVNMPVIKKWEENGKIASLEVYAKCFSDSYHVAHYLKHKKEYEEELTIFLEKVGMLQPAKGRAVLS